MRALVIVFSILAALLLLLLAKLRITLSYGDELSLSARYLLFRFSLYPRKRRRKKPTKTVKKKKSSETATTKATDKKGASSEKKPKRRLSFGDIRFLLRILRETLAKILDKASRHVRITVRELRVTIGGERDAAAAAIEYGLVSQTASYLLAYLDHTGFLKPPRAEAIDLRVNFTERGHTLAARIEVSCPVIFLIPLLFSSLAQALAARGRWSRYRAASAKKRTATQKPKENENV